MQQVNKLNDDDYDAFEDTIASSVKGRAFLREHARRNRVMSVGRGQAPALPLARRLSRPDGRGGGGGVGNARIEMLRAELHDMSASIAETKRQIVALQPKDTGKNRILAATGELDAIVSATERATSEIISQAEMLIGFAGDVRDAGHGGVADKIEASATEILMACSFQDITGQRTSKVVNAMRYLEQRINSMMTIWGVDAATANFGEIEDEDTDLRPDAHLLNGPAMEGEGVNQDDIDALFDAPAAAEPAPPPPPAKPVKAVEKPAEKPADKPKAKGKEPPKPEPQMGAAMAQDDIDSLFS